MKELYARAANRLADVGPTKFDEMIQYEIKCAAGLLHPEAGARLAANKLGIRAEINEVKVNENAYVYTFVASRKCADLRRDPK